MTKKEFGHWFKTTRSSLNFTQEQVAKALGLKKHDVAKFEAGVASFPVQKITSLALMFKVEKKFVLEMTLVVKEYEGPVKKLRKAS